MDPIACRMYMALEPRVSDYLLPGVSRIVALIKAWTLKK